MKPASSPPIPPLLAILFAILTTSTASIFIRYAQNEAASIVIAAARLTIATLILAPIVLTKRREELSLIRGRELGLGLLSGTFLALHFATWITSLEYTTVASSVVLVATIPLWVALLSPLALKESITRLVWMGLVLAFLGSAIVGLSDACTLSRSGLVCPTLAEFVRGKAFLGDMLALAGAVSGAFYLLIGRRLLAGMSLLSYIFIVYGMGAAVLLVLMFVSGETLLGYQPDTYMWLLLLALVPQLIGHSSFNWALRYLSAAYVSVTLLGEPVGSTILAYFLLNEAPTSLKIFGAILILTGIYIASIPEARKV
ncbi:MAG: DMT family transporter [Chloroflexi bacterium]|nr:MAG: DMT family transporter [Chloroflexota bacterium]